MRRGQHGRHERRRAHLACGLGLQRLQQPQRAPELGQRRAAIAQQRVERPGAVAVADHGQPEIPITPGMPHEQLGLDALGTLEPPSGAGDARGEQPLQRAVGRQLLAQRRLQRHEFRRLLVAHHHEFLRTEPVLERVLRRARLAFGGLRATRSRAVDAAGLGAGAARKSRAKRGSKIGHDGFLRWWGRRVWSSGAPEQAAAA